MRKILVAVASIVLCVDTTAHAQPAAPAPAAHYLLRMATAAPDGTAWARELRAFTQEVENVTHGEVRVKLYLGGIAGNELETAERMRRGQLDAVASGGILCQQLAPSLRLMRVRGLFESHAEANWVLNRLKPIFDEEFRQHGVVHLGFSSLGPDVLFLRHPVRSLDDLRKERLWRWNLDETALRIDREMGMPVVPLPVEDAGRAYDEGQVDGFISVPAAALAFQFSARVRYLLDLQLGFLWGCLIVDEKAMNKLPNEHRQVVMAATAKLAVRIDEVGEQQDALLMNGGFKRQGLQQLPVPPSLRADVRAAALKALDRLGDRAVPRAVLDRARAEIERYRSEHKTSPSPR